jgi:hypothetical protein
MTDLARGDIAERIVRLVAKHAGLAPERVRLQDRLLHDLGIYGDDGEEILVAVAGEFGLDIGEIEADKYFLPEISPYWLLPGFMRQRALRGMKELTVADLVESATTGSWVFRC